MPKITSTITRAQSEAKNIPALPKALDQMDDYEAHEFFSRIREGRIVASEKRKAVRDRNKKSKKQQGELVANAASDPAYEGSELEALDEAPKTLDEALALVRAQAVDVAEATTDDAMKIEGES